MALSDENGLEQMDSQVFLELDQAVGAGANLAPSDEQNNIAAVAESEIPPLDELSNPLDEEQIEDRSADGPSVSPESLDESASDTANAPSEPDTDAPIERRPIVFCKSLAYLQILSTSGICRGHAAASCTVRGPEICRLQSLGGVVKQFVYWFNDEVLIVNTCTD